MWTLFSFQKPNEPAASFPGETAPPLSLMMLVPMASTPHWAAIIAFSVIAYLMFTNWREGRRLALIADTMADRFDFATQNTNRTAEQIADEIFQGMPVKLGVGENPRLPRAFKRKVLAERTASAPAAGADLVIPVISSMGLGEIRNFLRKSQAASQSITLLVDNEADESRLRSALAEWKLNRPIAVHRHGSKLYDGRVFRPGTLVESLPTELRSNISQLLVVFFNETDIDPAGLTEDPRLAQVRTLILDQIQEAERVMTVRDRLAMNLIITAIIARRHA